MTSRFTPAPAGCPLTPAMFAAVQAVARGRTRQQHARDVGVAPTTVRTLLGRAYQRLGVSNAAHAVASCVAHGWLVVDDGEIIPTPAPCCIDCGNPLTSVGYARHAHRVSRDLGVDAGEFIGFACGDCQGADERATSAQRVYLYAVEAFLRARDADLQRALLLIMVRAREDAGLVHPSERRDAA